MIRVEQLNKSFGQLQVLKNIGVEIPASKVITIVGPSGAGKTTFLHIIGTLMRADGGRVYYDSTCIQDLSEKQVARFRNEQIGFVFQFHHLLPEFTALENVCMPAFIRGERKIQVEKEARRILSFLGLESRITHKPSELSGGEQQRVAVARALINNPKVILADEPSGNLDTHNKEELHNLFFQLSDELKQTFIIVTHDKDLAAQSHISLKMVDGYLTN